MLTSRRALVTGLAALPLATTASASVDPILAAIARYRRAFAVLEAAPDDAAAEAELFAAHDALLATPPRTVAGCQALVNLAIEEADEDGTNGDGDRPSILEVLRQGLDWLAV